jgi:ribosomal-protein-alanine N-acetyltransferase
MTFKLRLWTLADLDSLVKYANNAAIARFLTDQFPHPYTHDHGRIFIGFATSNAPAKIFAIEINNEAAGAIGIHPQTDIYRKNAELGYWLGEPFWGRGIITQAIGQMVDFAFQNLDIERIFARPFGSNKASQRVLEKAGFVLEAHLIKTLFKNGNYEDELIYAVRRSQP